uniref:Prolactin releasing hormone 2 n=2 Tax=Gasterosteus aculeatus TaxID=69293 RepID=A0AAQ4RYS9_GASAC|nr:prolactin releasing hormone 2 [Gasterosteus aculeatus aculeatus]XP_040023404.1 prolactin releasing hormone 2 [Gasterosteus aculeatus aculeatus]
MLPSGAVDVRRCVLTSRWLPASLLLLLLLSSSLSRAHSTTMEHDFHIAHNVDNRSPEIDPFWYVGRGVRPIGRFGKRHGPGEAVGSRGVQPVLRALGLVVNSLRNKDNFGKVLDREDRDWLPRQRVLLPSSTNSRVSFF